MFRQNRIFLSTKLRMLRLDRGMSQEEFASELGISRCTLANYEAGKRHPSRELLKKIAILCQTPEEMLCENPLPYGIRFQESEEEKTKRFKHLMKGRGDHYKLDISDLSMEYKFCVIEYYDYIVSLYQKKNEDASR